MRNLKITFSVGLILIITFIAFYPCLKNGFVNWDDDKYVIENSAIKFLSAENTNKILTSFFAGNYQPLTILSYLPDYRFFRLNPAGYHLTNLILHLFNCLLVFWLIVMISGRVSVAFIVSVFFGVHPLHVESVAWISERKDALYAAFFLGAIICYLKYLREERKLKYYLFSIFLFVLSLLSKSMAITLPLVLLLIDYLLHRKHDKYMFIDKVPFFLLSLIFGIIAVYSQNSGGALIYHGSHYFLATFTTLSYCIIFYLNKIFIPVKLSCLYPYYGAGKPLSSLFFPAMFIILFLAAVFSGKYTKKFIFGGAFFVIIMLPVLQIIPLGETIVADRYTYISSIGIFYILAEIFIWLYARRTKYRFMIRASLSAVLIGLTCLLVFLTWNRCKVWHDGVSLWSDVLKNYPKAATAYNNRGIAFYLKGEYVKAQSDFNHTAGPDSDYLRRDKDAGYVFYNLNLSGLYNSSGQHQRAAALLENAVKKDPKHRNKYYINLAVSYAGTGKTEQAIALLQGSIKDNLNKCEACYNLGLIYKNMGNRDKAVELFNESIGADPGFADSYYALGRIYQRTGEISRAIFYYKKAMQLDPDKYGLHNNKVRFGRKAYRE